MLTTIENQHPQLTVVTQNIDGMHQRAGTRNVIELHGSLWRLGCPAHGIFEDTSGMVWPAAGFPHLAKDSGAWCIEINPEASELSHIYHETIRLPASEALLQYPFNDDARQEA